MRLSYCCWLLGATLAAGCAHQQAAVPPQPRFQPPPPNIANTPPPPVRPETNRVIVTPGGVIGKVALVNASGRFVVVSFPLGSVPSMDKRLNLYRGGLKVGEIKISRFQRDQNAVADIVAGDSQIGDEVKED